MHDFIRYFKTTTKKKFNPLHRKIVIAVFCYSQ